MSVSTVWLKEQDGQRAFFPDGNKFQFTSNVPVLMYTFTVEGSAGLTSGSSSSFVQPAAVSYHTGPPASTFRKSFTPAR